jgi:hypothetical protein
LASHNWVPLPFDEDIQSIKPTKDGVYLWISQLALMEEEEEKDLPIEGKNPVLEIQETQQIPADEMFKAHERTKKRIFLGVESFATSLYFFVWSQVFLKQCLGGFLGAVSPQLSTALQILPNSATQEQKQIPAEVLNQVHMKFRVSLFPPNPQEPSPYGTKENYFAQSTQEFHLKFDENWKLGFFATDPEQEKSPYLLDPQYVKLLNDYLQRELLPAPWNKDFSVFFGILSLPVPILNAFLPLLILSLEDPKKIFQEEEHRWPSSLRFSLISHNPQPVPVLNFDRGLHKFSFFLRIEQIFSGQGKEQTFAQGKQSMTPVPLNILAKKNPQGTWYVSLALSSTVTKVAQDHVNTPVGIMIDLLKQNDSYDLYSFLVIVRRKWQMTIYPQNQQ